MEVITPTEIGIVIGLLVGLNMTAVFTLWVLLLQSRNELKMLNFQLCSLWVLNRLEKDVEKK